jgi:hypothetical protein
MEGEERARLVTDLGAAFGGAEDVTPAEGQVLHVLLPQLELPAPWQPSPTRAMTVWEAWPSTRPQFLVDESVVAESGEPPRSNHQVFVAGESWRGFSFAFDWVGGDPVRAIQLWMERFVVERS